MPTAPLFEKKNILVTGGAGFIGSFLCEKLLAEARVICVDNFISSQESNIDHLLKNPDFEFIRHDINLPFDLEAFPELVRFKLKFQGIQEIYHLACPTSAKKFDQYKMQTLYANSLGMKNVLDLAVKYKAKTVHASTAVVYGPRPADGHMFKEKEAGSVDMLSTRSCYDEGKRFAEAFCATYSQVHKLDIRIARIFRTYGPRMMLFDGQMIPDFITGALDGKDLVIYGDETFSTSLCYVGDIVDGLMKLMESPANVSPINLGSDFDMPIVSVAQRIIEMTGSSSRITFQPPLLFITPLGLPDLTDVKEKLSWLPLVSLDDGLKKTIDYTIAHKGLLGFKSA
ncbi:NAD-dependent epimerase/dehydratase family protein [Patescibacteria group bacterium]|nr:NAD-dependent epimerase/dehydratase family protein [Patescibacteria group bacterium]MBU1034832.1 NAD-dependent epimerase/dehydratase family protein [Patescibacteria group bacterium]MBU1629890.1 NAD-dependent epimerase/dehydratase family protein [Patescibacteria group bacterium]MBU1907731.1 NAD-dependent epimerase/dehydratase family protein [Patescibacteria group bacterium]